MDSVKEELKTFCETTSMRGVPRIPKSKEKFVKVMWILMVILCLAGLITVLVVIIQKFSSWPAATESKEDLDNALDFPDVTICSLNRFLNHYRGNISLHDYFQYMGHYGDSYKEKILYKSLATFIRSLPKNEIFDADDCPPFIADCTIYSTGLLPLEGCEKNFTRVWNSDYHSCYTIRTNKLYKSDIRKLILLLNLGPQNSYQIPYEMYLQSTQSNGIRVMIHSPGTSPSPKRGFNLSPSTDNLVKIVQTNIKRLEKPYNPLDCMKRTIMPNSTSETYGIDQCIDYCKQFEIYKICDCVGYWYLIPESLANISTCGNASYSDPQKWIDEMKKLLCGLNVSAAESGCRNECLLPCQEQYYESYVVSTSWPADFQQVGIYQSYFNQCIDNFPEVKKRYAAYEYFSNLYTSRQNVSGTNYSIKDLKELGESFLVVKFVMMNSVPLTLINKPLYTWDVMTGLIGGQLSLWLGLSAMTIAEVLEFIYHVVIHYFKTKFFPAHNQVQN